MTIFFVNSEFNGISLFQSIAIRIDEVRANRGFCQYAKWVILRLEVYFYSALHRDRE